MTLKGLILILFIFFSFNGQTKEKEEDFYFFGQQKDLIKWDKLNPRVWNDFATWKTDLKGKEETENFLYLKKHKMLKEKIGRILQCIGECQVFKGEAFNNARFRSLLKEGDEVQTADNSFLWLFLIDGTMVRLAPNSSISLLEINIGINEIFFLARINYGNVLWLSRETRQFKEDNERETDVIFYPLDFIDANKRLEKLTYNEKNLYGALRKTDDNLNQVKRLNQLISENNLIMDYRPTYSFLIMPNGSLFGKNLQLESIVLDGGPSFVKRRTTDQLRIKSGEIPAEDQEFDSKTRLYYRGFDKKEFLTLDDGYWYFIDPNGNEIGQAKEKNGPEYAMGEFITSRITTILVARELMLRDYSTFIFDEDINSNVLAKKHGYRLWGSLTEVPKKDLRKRFEFLKEYTRRIETTNLIQRDKYRDRLERRGETIIREAFSNRFYAKALRAYYIDSENFNLSGEFERTLNSTNNLLFKRYIRRR